jgi:hypothetical protein
MADKTQSYQNHARILPPFHYFVAPVLLINVLVASWRTVQAPSFLTGWGIVLAVALVVAIVLSRTMALSVQDRVIRLEMRMRLQGLLPPDLRPRVNELTRQQLIALRFASDEEVSELMRDVLAGKLQTQKAIKQQIRNWQPDELRC